MLFRYIKEYHAIQSRNQSNQPNFFLTEEINEWVQNTYVKYEVNIWAFADDYLNRFYDDISLWPEKHKLTNKEDLIPYSYDYTQKSNLFNLNTLYPRISKKPFMKGRKEGLELIFMYIWLHNIDGDESYWDEYFSKYILKGKK